MSEKPVSKTITATYPGVRSAAIEALGNIEYAPDIIGALLGVFEKLRWWDKQRAIKCLRELETQDSEAVSALLVRCLDEESWDVQIEACITLGEFAEPNAVQSLGTLLLRTLDDDVRLAAARALKSIRNDASLTCLQESLKELKEDRPDTYRELLEQLERPASGRR